MKPPSFPFYVKDWLSGTRRLSLAAKGAYIDLLAWSWDNGPVPRNVTEIAKILSATDSETTKIWRQLRTRSFRKVPNGYVNPRLEQERAKSKAFTKLQAEKGRRSAARKTQPRFNRGSTAVATDGQPALALSSASASIRESTSPRAVRALRAQLTNPSVRPLTKIAHGILDEVGTGALHPLDVHEELKCQAARSHLPHDGRTLTKALDNALTQRKLR